MSDFFENSIFFFKLYARTLIGRSRGTRSRYKFVMDGVERVLVVQPEPVMKHHVTAVVTFKVEAAFTFHVHFKIETRDSAISGWDYDVEGRVFANKTLILHNKFTEADAEQCFLLARLFEEPSI